MTYDTVFFKGHVATLKDGYWHVDFRVFSTLYAAKGHILRRIKS
jgi:hypothetical protein